MIQRILATPSWADFKEIRRIYRAAHLARIEHRKMFVVDHIIPLNHPMVCGLHVHYNLQVVTERANAAKANTWCPDQLELAL